MEPRKYHNIRLSRAGNDTWKFIKEQKALELPIISIATIVNCIVANKYYDILAALLYEVIALFIICLLLFLWKSLRVVPERIYNEQQDIINSKQKTIESLEEQQKPKLQIDFDKDNPKYLYIDDEGDGKSYVSEITAYRIFIRNTSQMQTTNNVEVRIISIEDCPEWLKRKTPIILNCNKQESFHIHPGKDQPVNVVQYLYDSRPDEKQFAFCSNKRFQIPDGNFKIKIEVSAENISCKSKDFIINLKYDEQETKKMISMKEC